MGGGSRLGRFVNAIEEGVIAFLFAAMTLVTFSQVVARYVFNSGAVWAVELTTNLFAWMVLFGISYGVKVNAHLGVDAFVRLFDSRFAQAGWMIVTGRKTGLLIGDEAQDAIRQHLKNMKDESESGGTGAPPR